MRLVATNRLGMALLEVMVALAVLSIAGVGTVSALRAAGLETTRMEDGERRLRDEDRILTAMSLLEADELDRRLGSHEVGAYLVSVSRPERQLYRIAIVSRDAPGYEDLVTIVYRVSADAQ